MSKKKKDKKSRNDFFLRKDFSWYDTAITAVLGADTVAVWEHLYCFIQRSDLTYGHDCVSVVRQSKIAELCGISKRSVIRRIKTLQDMGFIIVYGEREHTKYKMGTWYPDDDGKRNEEIYGIQRVREALEILTVWALTNGYKSVISIPVNTRVEIVGEYLDGLEVVTESHEASDAEAQPSDTEAQGLMTEVHNPCDTVALQEVYKEKLSKNQIEKIQENQKGNLGVLRTGNLPPERSGGGQEVGIVGSAEVLTTECNKKYAPVTRRVEPSKDVMDLARAKTGSTSDTSLRKTQAREAKILNLAGSKKLEGPDPAISLLERFWKKHYKINFPGAPLAKWGGKERGQVMNLIEKYDGRTIQNLFDYALNEWDRVVSKFRDGPDVPSVGWLLSMHATVVPAADKYSKVAVVWRKWQSWRDANPDSSEPPEELEAEYDKHQKEIERLGLLRRT
jgi:hypothetical protein